MGGFLSAFVLAVELSGAATKTVVGISIEIPFAIGESIVSVIGYGVKDWRDFHVIN